MSKTDYTEIGAFIRELREKKKMPLRKLAAELDIDTSTLSKIEKGERQANTEMLPILAKIFGLDYKQLQVKFLSDKLADTFGNEEHIVAALKETIKKVSK